MPPACRHPVFGQPGATSARLAIGLGPPPVSCLGVLEMSPTGSSVTPATYTFRVRILGGVYAPPDGRQIWRELELTGEQTFGDLGEAIPLAFGFDDPHLWSFFLSGKPWDDATEYAPSPSPNHGRPARAADRLRIRDAPASKEFLFLFDYGDEWHFGV